MAPNLYLFFMLALIVFSGSPAAASNSKLCSIAVLSKALPENATILSTDFILPGQSHGEGAANPAFPTNPTDLPATCAVLVNVTTSETSSYRFGLFLPITTWNERYLTVGNGGFSGGINWLDMGAGVRYGFAVASTDMGHNSTMTDITWALGQPEKQLDFGFRATHGTTVIAKRLTETFYASKINYSYYSGCSTGGRQGLKDAQLFPDDFDGLLIRSSGMVDDTPSDVDCQSGICDASDGVTDGIISAPHECRLDVDRLLCNTTNTCISPEQAQTVQNIHSNYTINGQFTFPGLEIGSEGEWNVLLSGPEPAPLGVQYIQNMLLDDPQWSWQDYTDSLVALADDENPGDVTADDFAAMSQYLSNGGKVLMYHGMADGLIPTGSSTYFYESVAREIAGHSNISDSFRLFLVPGLHHCVGTSVDAPWYFAGANQAGILGTSILSVPGFEGSKHDALMALMEWVENGRTVETIVATTWINATDSTSDVLRQRPLCPYPARASLKNSDIMNSADAWVCE
ncbi:hypothetical protein ACHAPC_008173 [Botrytis cinerea]